jgi:hypothetical protein
MGWGMIFDVLDKFIPSRKAAMVDRMRELEYRLAEALRQKDTSTADAIRVQLKDLRKKLGFTQGDV